jgi:hypothetical protein
MAKALFIQKKDITRFTAANGSIDTDKLLPYIDMAQDIDIQRLLGSKLYDKISADITAAPQTLTGNYLTLVDTYIKPTLIHYALMYALPYLSVTIGNGGVYRKEDILRMSKKVVNAGFGKGGSDTYSIWLYKGGARCSHKWFRKTYQVKDGKKTEITTGQARSKGFKAPVNEQKVSVAPRDMENEGFVNKPKKKK